MSTTTDARDILNVSADQMHAALEVYRGQGLTEKQLKLIEWTFIHCSQSLGRSRSRLADELGFDVTNVWKIFMGRYEGSMDNVCAAMEAMQKRCRETVRLGFVRTPVTERIYQAIDYAHTMGEIVVVRGDTGRGKSLTGGLYHSEHNHGSTFFVELEERTTYARAVRSIAIAMGANRDGTSRTYRAYIERRLGRNKTLIIDEAGHLYNPKRPDPASFDFLRNVQDKRHCGLVLIFTLPYWYSIVNGPMAGYFEQFLGRVGCEVEIPPGVIFREEIDAICGQFCRQTGCDPEPALIAEATRVAKAARGRIRALVSALQQAVIYARSQDAPLNARALRSAIAIRERGGSWDKLTKA